MNITIARLPGDGIGPEVTEAASSILNRVADQFGHKITWLNADIGGAAIDQSGTPLPDSTLRICKESDAILLGAIGGPAWANHPQGLRPEQGLLDLRSNLGLFANLRPIPAHPQLASLSPLKADRMQGVDLLIVRELTGGIYFGRRSSCDDSAMDECAYSKHEIQRVARVAFDAARQRNSAVCSVDKANVLATSRLWRRTVQHIHETEYPDVNLEHQLVDAMAMHLITRPGDFDVVLTENMFGDILSDEASVLAGSLGVLPSASLGATGPGLFEPCHGSAPDIAGKGIANPIAAILSAAMLMRNGLKLENEADAIEVAVENTIQNHIVTPDLGGTATTRQCTEHIAKRLTHDYVTQ